MISHPSEWHENYDKHADTSSRARYDHLSVDDDTVADQ